MNTAPAICASTALSSVNNATALPPSSVINVKATAEKRKASEEFLFWLNTIGAFIQENLFTDSNGWSEIVIREGVKSAIDSWVESIENEDLW